MKSLLISCRVFKNLNADVAPVDLFADFGLAVADAVDLEGDDALRGHVVLEVGAEFAVEVGPDGVAFAFDASEVPAVDVGEFLTLG